MTAALATRGDPTRVEGVEARAVEATLACLARHGLTKTTIDDIAREAGCSRATLYRYFGSKQDLVTAAVRFEVDRVTMLIEVAAAGAETLEDAVVAMLEVADHELGQHPALGFVAEFEPERLLPHLTFVGGDEFLREAAVALAPCLARFVPADPERAAEWVARIGLTLWMSPAARTSLGTRADLRAYVHDFVVPALDGLQRPFPVSSAPNPSRG